MKKTFVVVVVVIFFFCFYHKTMNSKLVTDELIIYFCFPNKRALQISNVINVYRIQQQQ